MGEGEIFRRRSEIPDPGEDPNRIPLNLTAKTIPTGAGARGGPAVPTNRQNDSAKWKSGITGNEYRQLVDADGAGLGVHRFQRRREASGRRRRGIGYVPSPREGGGGGREGLSHD